MLRRDRWAKYRAQAQITMRVPALSGGLEDHIFAGRLAGETEGWVILEDYTAIAAGKNREDVPMAGEKWIRRESIVNFQRLPA